MPGTRAPYPIGVLPAYSPGVPGSAYGGSTWSKYPSFSSNVMISNVLFHRSGLLCSVWMTRLLKCAPCSGLALGCSDQLYGATTHETWGSGFAAPGWHAAMNSLSTPLRLVSLSLLGTPVDA